MKYNLRWNVNTSDRTIPIISYAEDSFKNLALSGVGAGEFLLFARAETQFSELILIARSRLQE